MYALDMSTLKELLDHPDQLASRLPELAGDPHVLVGVLGAVMLVAGKRLYGLAIMAPGVAAGVMVGLAATEGQDLVMRLMACGALAIIAAFILYSAERLAIAAAGSFVAVGLVRAAAPMVMGGPAPWFLMLAGGIVGIFFFPKLYRKLLVVIAPAIGAMCMAWAVGREGDLMLVIGLTLLGTVIQLVLWSGVRD